MIIFRPLLCAALVLGSLCLLPGTARAAQSLDTCAGFIDSLPATISTQGVWCLRKDLATSMTSGNAINITTNNVTIDCNDFKIGGLAAGNASYAFGIFADNRQNVSVRHCNVRGFYRGIYLNGGAGHLVEDNRLDNNLYMGIHVAGDNNLVQRNRVYDTGGGTGSDYTYGIAAAANLIGNTASGLFADTAGGMLYGIHATATGAQVRDNTVSGFDMSAVQGGSVAAAVGINLYANRQRASGSHVVGNGGASYGILAFYTSSFCLNNTAAGFANNIHANCISSGNLTSP